MPPREDDCVRKNKLLPIVSAAWRCLRQAVWGGFCWAPHPRCSPRRSRPASTLSPLSPRPRPSRGEETPLTGQRETGCAGGQTLSHSHVEFCPITPLPGDPQWRCGRSLRVGGPEPDLRKGVAYMAWRSAVLQCCTLLAFFRERGCRLSAVQKNLPGLVLSRHKHVRCRQPPREGCSACIGRKM